ncbi:MAG: ribosome recycling factor [Verrucomicrobia bacterium GWF2_51_19]|nr:MAG: ribosome recycling factor [Verrucomicrobia bacterium GWF2_51_19]HCJ11498.1 ribosome recycling factor [Opitutae bacterium]
MDTQKILKDTDAKMAKALDHTLHEFSTIHTGKASPSMVENVSVFIESYGTNMLIKDIAAVTTPDAKTIRIEPWDKGTAKAIEKGIQVANIGLNPAVDGCVIRCFVPELSRERRQELVKTIHNMAENGRVAIRGVRRDAMDVAKKSQKDGLLSEDDFKRIEKDIQNKTDKVIEQIATHIKHKEQELMKL